MTYSYQTTRKACYLGSIIQAITVNVPPVFFVIFQEDYGISYAQLGTLILLTFVVQIVVDFVLAKVAHRFHPRRLLQTAALLALIGYALMAATPVLFSAHTFVGLLAAVLVYSAGSGFLEVMTSPVVNALPSEDKGSSMAFLHSFYCWGQLGAVLLTTLLLQLVGHRHWQWILVFWMLFPAVNFYLMSRVPMPPMESGASAEGKAGGGMRRLMSLPLFWVAFIIMASAGASELAMSQWASLFAQKGLGLSKTLGDLAGPCFFALLMGLGRMIYGIQGDRLKMNRALMLSAILCIVSYLLTALSPWPLLSLLGCGLCGLSVAIMWPGTLVMASRAIPGGGTMLFALMALGGDVGCSLGPWLTGMVSDHLQTSALAAAMPLSPDQLALRGGLLCAIIFPALLLFFTPILTKKKGERHE